MLVSEAISAKRWRRECLLACVSEIRNEDTHVPRRPRSVKSLRRPTVDEQSKEEEEEEEDPHPPPLQLPP